MFGLMGEVGVGLDDVAALLDEKARQRVTSFGPLPAFYAPGQRRQARAIWSSAAGVEVGPGGDQNASDPQRKTRLVGHVQERISEPRGRCVDVRAVRD